MPVAALAPAKINLALHVTGRRADGYHLLDSIVVFTELGDRVALEPGAGLCLARRGAHGTDVPPGDDNLVLRAARLIGAHSLRITLSKRLPAASGMGGGSSDAACTLRLAARAQGLELPGTEALMRLGADLPVCMAAPAPSRMQGLGEIVTPLAGVPALWMLLANPGLPLATPSVFRALERPENPPLPPLPEGREDARRFCAWLGEHTRNDLQQPASALMPEIGSLLDDIARQPGCLLARMTGSGATCFGLFDSRRSLRAARAALALPGRFVAATRSLPSTPTR
ncbi:MAG: 4-(cytidine 5'-diphospho)-2-C-methyl-D-erythritol kinase [Pararhodobacter sp.]|nr:4-(cytidine 5'-diphospho)-2-C-methyl-D-erythritol kinase [Pararhodobacter sp.]